MTRHNENCQTIIFGSARWCVQFNVDRAYFAGEDDGRRPTFHVIVPAISRPIELAVKDSVLMALEAAVGGEVAI